MEILSYSPSVEVYAEVIGKDGAKTYYDLSDDVTSCSVSRQTDTQSTCSVKLQNRQFKYNSVFTPMDKLTIYATKQSRVQLFSGYITKVTQWSLYQHNFEITGVDSIYLLKQTFWDPGLQASMVMMDNEYSASESWTNFATIISKLITKVGNWPEDSIVIGEIPDEVITWAKKLYEQKISDITKLKKNVDEFYKILQTSGPKSGGTSGGSLYSGVMAGGAGVAANANIEAAIQWYIANLVNNNSVGYNQDTRCMNPNVDCSSSIYYALLNGGGFTTAQLGEGPWCTSSMIGILEPLGFVVHNFSGDLNELMRGDIMLNPGVHTELYIGGGQTVGAHDNYDDADGDSSGREVSIGDCSTNWQYYLRLGA